MSNTSGFFVIGAGSFGTALAIHLARLGENVSLWGNNPDALVAMQEARCNERYLPDVSFPETLSISNQIENGLAAYRDIFIVVPSHAFRDVLKRLKPYLRDDHRLLWGSKGLDPLQGDFLQDVAKNELGDRPMAVLSGPSFAKEVALGFPTAVVIAGTQKDYVEELVRRFSGEKFRAYQSDDMVGVCLGGAMKNVLAIAVGISDGLGFGANARSALMTRGLAEMVRLGVACGAEQSTFLGLAGTGDVILTCTDDQSRNRRFGLALGRGEEPEAIKKNIGQAVEGATTASLIDKLGKQHDVDLPITQMVCQALAGKLSIQEAVQALFSRELKAE